MTRNRMLVPTLDRAVLVSLCSVAHRAYLDALREVQDLEVLPEGLRSDALEYWGGEAHRLETAHLWLLEVLAEGGR